MDIVGKIFSVLFLAECLAKILALGFISGHHAYLQEAWNYLDLLVVIVGIMEFFDIDGSGSLRSYTALDLPSKSLCVSIPTYDCKSTDPKHRVYGSALRAIRVLRPLRLVNRFPELRETASVFIKVLPGLSNVVGLIFFLLLAFGILGVQLFAGGLRGRCYSFETGR